MEAAISPTAGMLSHSFESQPSNEKISSPSKGPCCGCLRRAPLWLKVVFLFSVILLLSAIALVAIGFSLGLEESDDNNVLASERGFPEGIFPTTTTAPASQDTPAAAPDTPMPTTPMDDRDSTPAPVATEPPTRLPTTLPPTSSRTAPPQALATAPPIPDNTMVVYFTAGRYPDYLLDQAPDLLGALPGTSSNAFLVHLGDWNFPPDTQCDKNSYKDVTKVFEDSKVPVQGEWKPNQLVAAVVVNILKELVARACTLVLSFHH